jgi:hypothetical protein
MDEEVLFGGVANSGAVTRAGDEVRRPASPFTASIFALLGAVRSDRFEGVQTPKGVDGLGRERLGYVEGDVPLPPYPDWAQTEGALGSITVLIRQFHEATRTFDPNPFVWNGELADPEGGPVVCHNDVCLENVVFRDGVAVALIDFDYAAPGRPVYDLAQFTKMCVPLEDDVNGAQLGWSPADRPGRLRLVADAYGLDAAERAALLKILDDQMATCGEFVRRHAEAGHPGFEQMWNEAGGAEFYERRKRWWALQSKEFESRLR